MNKYIIFIRSLNIANNRIKMIEFKDELLKIKQFKNVITYIQTGNLIIDYCNTATTTTKVDKEDDEEDDEDVDEKLIVNKLIKDCLYNEFSIDTQLIVYDIDEYKSILSNNPFEDDIEIKKTYYYFPCETPIDKSIYDITKSEFKKDSKWELINGVIYYIGRQTGNSTDLKVLNTLNKYTKSTPNRYTARNYNTVYKMLSLFNNNEK